MSGRATTSRTEIAIVGGGLAGGLIALALRRARPELSVHLYEAGPMLGGNHRWSWFDSDLDDAGTALLAPFRKVRWQGYDVQFPAHRRTLGGQYNSLASSDFDAALRRELGRRRSAQPHRSHRLMARGSPLPTARTSLPAL